MQVYELERVIVYIILFCDVKSLKTRQSARGLRQHVTVVSIQSDSYNMHTMHYEGEVLCS